MTCQRWYQYPKCWNCEKFKPGKTCHCGTCEDCDCRKSDWFVGCEYCKEKGKKIKEMENK